MTKIMFEEEDRMMKMFYCRRTMSAGDKVIRKYRRAMIRRAEYVKLKAIVPAVAQKKSVTKLTVIEEAIKYINELHEALASKLHDPSRDFDTKSSSSLLSSSPHLFFMQLYNNNLPATNNYPAKHRTNEPDILRHVSLTDQSVASRTDVERLSKYCRSARQPLADVQPRRH